MPACHVCGDTYNNLMRLQPGHKYRNVEADAFSGTINKLYLIANKTLSHIYIIKLK